MIIYIKLFVGIKLVVVDLVEMCKGYEDFADTSVRLHLTISDHAEPDIPLNCARYVEPSSHHRAPPVELDKKVPKSIMKFPQIPPNPY